MIGTIPLDPFSRLLQQLLARMPGATGAVFVDWDGESVGQACADGADVESVRLLGAHWGVVYFLMRKKLTPRLAGTETMVLGFSDRQVVISPVTEEYLLIVEASADASPGQAMAICGEVSAQLQEEM